AEVRKYCEVEPAAKPLLRAAAQRLQLSARAFHRALKLARAIADLAESDTIVALARSAHDLSRPKKR
ncbi:MAG: YifB family Mg chelatase-like AAA ATPase, partial [Ktedonobacterales bacterium]